MSDEQTIRKDSKVVTENGDWETTRRIAYNGDKKRDLGHGGRSRGTKSEEAKDKAG